MNGITKSKSTKLLSALLAVLMIVAMLPTTAFAWSVEEGTKCTSTYGDHYVGSDGEMFYSNDKNYGYTCISTQNGEKVYCQAVLITPQKNVVTIEADRIYTGSTDYLKDFIIKAVESVKLVGNK